MSSWRVEGARSIRPRVSARPHPLLRRLLARDHAGVTAAAAPHRLLLPATAAVSLVVKIDDSPYRPPAFLLGAHDRPALMEGECARRYLTVWLAPLGAYRLLGRPVRELGGTVVDLHELFGPTATRLTEAIRAEPSWPGRFAALDRFLLAAAERGPRPAPEVARAWQRIVDSRGAAPIGRIAAEVGWSHQHLSTTFGEQVGLPPKTTARLVRLGRVLDAVRTGGAERWGRVAAEHGYADQPHLVREFRAFTGMTPTEYRERLIGVPAAG